VELPVPSASTGSSQETSETQSARIFIIIIIKLPDLSGNFGEQRQVSQKSKTTLIVRINSNFLQCVERSVSGS